MCRARNLAFDRTRKASIYARARISDYWIVNLDEQVVEIHRDPAPLEPPRRGWAYRALQAFRRSEAATPLGAPSAVIAVADLLP
jgi:Uma2 family endonuclease